MNKRLAFKKTNLISLVFLISSLFSSYLYADYEDHVIGNLEGEVAVSQGMLNYLLPLSFPEGINGIEPNLSIHYKQGSGAGLLGLGFSLGGLSIIERCATTKEIEGYESEIVVSTKSKYCLDGQRLIDIGGEFRTINDGNTKITFAGPISSPTSFNLYEPSGNLLIYRKHNVKGSNEYLSMWLLASKEDQFGNRIDFGYQRNEIEPIISYIEYAGYKVQFTYVSGGLIERFRGGKKISHNKIMTAVELYDRGEYISKYQFDYLHQSSLVPILSKVTKCFSTEKCLKPVSFQYEDREVDAYGEKVVIPASEFEAVSDITLSSFTSSDINLDGFTDLCMISVVNEKMHCSDRDGVTLISNEVKEIEGMGDEDKGKLQRSLFFTDLNNDIYPDYCYQSNSGLICSENNGQGSYRDSGKALAIKKFNLDTAYTLVDVDRDGLSDICFEKNRKYGCYKNISKKGKEIKFSSNLIFNLISKEDWFYEREWSWDYFPDDIKKLPPPIWQDVDLDRVPDLCYLSYKKQGLVCHKGVFRKGQLSIGEADLVTKVPLGKTGEIDDSLINSLFKSVWIDEQTVDYYIYKKTGEKVRDLKKFFKTNTAWKTKSGLNYRLESQKTLHTGQTMRFSDLNADGLSDICYFSSSNHESLLCQLNTGRGFNSSEKWGRFGLLSPTNDDDNFTYGYRSSYMMQDINLDGLEDLCVLYVDWYKCAINTGKEFGSLENALNVVLAIDIVKDRDKYEGDNKVQEWMGLSTTFYTSVAQQSMGPVFMLPGLDESGFPSLCYRGVDGIQCNSYDNINITRPISRLNKIESSYGLRTNINYRSTLDPSIFSLSEEWDKYAKIEGYVNLNPSTFYVSSIETDTGLKDESGSEYRLSNRYRYSDFLVHPIEGSLGIRSTELISENTSNRNIESTYVHPKMKGMVESVTHYVDGNKIKELDNSASLIELDGGRYRIQTTKTVETQFGDTGSVISEKITDFKNFDDYGYPEKTVVSAIVDGAIHSVETNTSYIHDQDKWILGRPKNVVVSHSKDDSERIIKETEFIYDDGLLVSQVLEPDNKNTLKTTYVYSELGLNAETALIGRSDSLGGIQTRKVKSLYDNLGRLVRHENALGHTVEYRYESTQCRAPSSIISANGLETKITYDALCRKSREDYADGNWKAWLYKWDDSLDQGLDYQQNGVELNRESIYSIEVESSNGNTTKTLYDSSNRKLREATKLDDQLVLVDYAYDQSGRLNGKTLPYYEGEFSGDGTSWEVSSYDNRNRITKVVKPNGASYDYVYEDLATSISGPESYSKRTEYRYDGKVLLNEESSQAKVIYEYDSIGQLIKTDTEGYIVSMQYDIFGNRTKLSDPAKGVWSYKYNAFGELIEQIDGKGQKTNLVYDRLGRLVSRKSKDEASEWKYDSKWIGELNEVKGRESRLTFNYDDLGRVISETNTIDGEAYSTSFEYDLVGRLTKTMNASGVDIHNSYNQTGQIKTVNLNNSDIWNYDYPMVRIALELMADRIQKLDSQADVLRARVRYYARKARDYEIHAAELYRRGDSYDRAASNLRGIANKLHRIANRYYRKYSQYRSISYRLRRAFGNATLGYSRMSGGWVKFSNTKCTRRNWTGRCRKKNNFHIHIPKAWVSYGRVCKRKGPRWRRYTSCRTQPRSIKPSQVYKSQAKKAYVVARRYKGYANHYQRKSNKYKAIARSLDQKAAWYMAKAREMYRAARANSNALRKVEAELRHLHKAQKALADTVGDMELPEGRALLWGATGYSAFGHLNSEVYGNGTLTHREWNEAGQLKRINSAFGGVNRFRDLNYEYDELGRITIKQDYVSGAENSYGYDINGRLTSWTWNLSGQKNFNRSYRYDARGNMTFKTGAGAMVYNSSNQLIERKSGQARYRYDKAGNMTAGDTRKYTWNSFNKVKQIIGRTDKTQFAYDANHNRVMKESKDSVVYYIRPGLEKEIRYEDGQEVIIWRHHIQSGHDAVATFEKRVENGQKTADQIAYIHRDAVGTADVITDAHANLISRPIYSPYGEVVHKLKNKASYRAANDEHVQSSMEEESQGARRLINSTRINKSEVYLNKSEQMSFSSQILASLRGYTSHEHIREQKLINMNARLYDPLIGRFISADSKIPDPGKVDSYNRYQYVYGDPIGYRDPDGHEAVTIAIAAAIFVGGQMADDQRIQLASAAVAAAVAAQPLAAAYGGGTVGAMASGATISFAQGFSRHGQLGTSMRDAFWGGVSAGAAYEIGGHGVWNHNMDFGQQLMLHGLTQGSIQAARGGSFAHGFVSAFVGKLTSPIAYGVVGSGSDPTSIALRTSIVTGMGYLSAKATGGDAIDAAMIAMMVHLYNDEGGAIAQKRGVRYDCGAGANCTIKNTGIKPALERLASQMSADGAGELVVTGGDSYVGADGRVYSHSTGEYIRGRGSRSFHNDNRGNRSVDIRSQSLTINESEIPSYIDKASGGDFKVWIDLSGRITDRYGIYHSDKHIHLTCNSQQCISN